MSVNLQQVALAVTVAGVAGAWEPRLEAANEPTIALGVKGRPHPSPLANTIQRLAKAATPDEMTLWIVGGFMFSVLAIVWVLYNMGQNVENKQRPCTAPAGTC